MTTFANLVNAVQGNPNASASVTAPLPAPAWGARGCGISTAHLDSLLQRGIAAWGCRAIWQGSA